MIKNLFMVTMVYIAVGIFGPAIAFAQDDIMTIESLDFDKRRRPPVLFPHGDHERSSNISSCSECHHVYENGIRIEESSSEGEPCAGCHAVSSKGNQPRLRQAFHQACRGCHLKNRKGPLMCGQCHKRQIDPEGEEKGHAQKNPHY